MRKPYFSLELFGRLLDSLKNKFLNLIVIRPSLNFPTDQSSQGPKTAVFA